MNMNVKDVLAEARNVIAEPRSWCKHFLSANTFRSRTEIDSEFAVRFCLAGSVQKAIMNLSGETHCEKNEHIDVYSKIINILTHELGQNIFVWNDSTLTKHADVIDLLDSTIEKL